MEIQTDVALAPYTTFHIGGPASFFCIAETILDIQQALEVATEHELPVLALGGGSNMLVSDRGYAGLVIHLVNHGIEMVNEDDESVQLRIASGEVWDAVVHYAVDRNLWGIENLSHIPGFMGGFAVQNVGAYGQEASMVVESVEAIEIHTGIVKTFTNVECEFSYRRSIFNGMGKGEYLIMHTTLRLSKTPQSKLEYGDVKKYFSERGIENPTLVQIREAITAIRDTKFPFPDKAENGNAGSFFRGPIIDHDQQQVLFEKVNANFGDEALQKLHAITDRLMVPQGMKMPTGFLIELCNLKGWRIGGAEVNPDQAAIILNATGTATASDVLSLFKHVRNAVYEKTGIELHAEPELIGFSPQELAAAFSFLEG